LKVGKSIAAVVASGGRLRLVGFEIGGGQTCAAHYRAAGILNATAKSSGGDGLLRLNA